MTTNF